MSESDQTQRRAARLVRSGLLDVEFYGALVDRSFGSEDDAALHAVTEGMPARLTFNPFVDFARLPQPVRRAFRAGRVGAVLKHVEAEELGAGPDQARAALLQVAHDLGARDRTELPDPLVDWEAERARLAERIPGRTSVVIPTYEDWFMTVRAATAAVDESDGADVEVVVVDNGSQPHVSLALAAALAAVEAVRVVHLPRNTDFAGGSNVGFAHSTGGRVVFLNNDTRARNGWLPPLLAPLDDPELAGAQSLLVFPDDTIQAAGTVFLDAGLLPAHLLVGHPRADADAVEGRRFSAATAAALALRAEDVVALRGFDPAYRNGFEDVDLSLRALELRPGGFRVATRSVVTHYESQSPGRFAKAMDNRRTFVRRWSGRLPEPEREVYADLGWELALPVADDGQPVPAARPAVVGRLRPDPARLRWGLRIPSTGGHWGDQWGDTHFAEELAGALRRLGQDAVVHRRDAHVSAATAYDDVSLVLRGRQRVDPGPGQTSVVWVISHPDEIADDELAGADVVCAASVPWAQERARALGRPVLPLLQATGLPAVAGGGDRSPVAVFVGSAEDRTRPMVHRAVEAGVPIEVYGRAWDGLPPGVWRAEHLPNDRLGELYRAHAVVIADHWPDMARRGFVANRVFDAVACGAQVLCDDVAGVAELFPGRVQVCRSAADLRTAYDAALAAPDLPVAETGLSFDDRARELLRVVRELRR
ncbi:glycosyltransferase [Nocardioides sp. YIM 152315]|uniref:glycosyltransferase n=1 Tax=Nocardioides sp. YIM 152315 TaxID=3031760 RepID=UPI0023DB40FD|nr:glycosyltransferase [Nocardioides sp. YIM 152315]MDF1604954.1 glycosyltransferase [Nocardioides sp. YIM 152315]